MKKYLKLLSMVIAMGVIATSCGTDDDDEVTPEPTTTQKIEGSWQLKASTVDPGLMDTSGNEVTDYYSILPDCAKDDYLTFMSDNSFTSYAGSEKCYDGQPDETSSGTWSLKDNDNTLVIEPTGGNESEATIISISTTEMKTRETQDLFGTEYTFTNTYMKK